MPLGMLDHRLFVEDAAPIYDALRSRGMGKDELEALALKAQCRRSAITHAETLSQKLNQASAEVGALARKGDMDAVAKAREGLQALKAEAKAAQTAAAEAEEALQTHLAAVPNLPAQDVPVGSDEESNVVVRTVGTPGTFSFAPKNHWDLGEDLGWLDFEAAAKMSGSRFAVLRREGARLERALAAMMLDLAMEHGYDEMQVPYLVRKEAMQGAGQYPKFVGEAFETLDREYALIPTSEVPLVNVHRDEILDGDKLPIRYVASTPCFRREAGAAGRDTRGLIRLHQFQKVELVSLCTPKESLDELERLVGHAEKVLQLLELPYRAVCLSTGDMGFAAQKTYDLEVWMPGANQYREISSCSNCSDFQARRMGIRYRPVSSVEDGKKKSKPKLVHTLNGSALAVGRTLVAVMENYQREDGSIEIPRVLQPYMAGSTLLSA